MKPLPAAVASALLTGLLFTVAWAFLSPAYETNDDVAIRLFLEGRIFPGAQPSGYAYFLNLALGQAIASLYRHAPGLSWYDVMEQGALAMTALIALYCCIRSVRRLDQIAFVALVGAAVLAVMAAIQFTIVAALSTTVGATALIFALTSEKQGPERLALSGAGAFLLFVGALLRLEAALLGFLVVILAGLPPLLTTLRQHGIRSRRSVFAFLFAASIGIALAWSYHFAVYLGSMDWKEFYAFNFLRAQLTEYATDRIPLDILTRAFGAAGWTAAEYQMLSEWIFFDAEVFSNDNLRKVVANLPVMSNSSPSDIINLLRSYCVRFPFFPLAIAGVIVTARVRSALAAVVSVSAIFAVIVLISVLLRPLEYRVFWPIAVGTVFVLWIALQRLQECPHWMRRVFAATLLSVASVLILVQTIERSQTVERQRQLSLSDAVRWPIGAGTLAVIIGGAFHFEALERPFGQPYLQRSIQALPIGTTVRAPPIMSFLKRVAVPDVPSWLCSDAVVLIARGEALSALTQYYERYRNQIIKFTDEFKGNTFNVFRCRVVS